MSLLPTSCENHRPFLTCPHPIWKDLHNLLYQHQLKNAISNIVHDLLAYGLYQGWQAPTNLNFVHLPNDLNDLHSTQECMGWKQLYCGQFTPLWHTYYSTIIYKSIVTLENRTDLAGNPQDLENTN